MSDRMQIAKGYEQALFAGDREGVGRRFTDDVVYWVAGAPPIGGEGKGRERSWLKSHPADVIDQRTCVVLKFRGDKICDTDSHIYEQFLTRHRNELPKFKRR